MLIRFFLKTTVPVPSDVHEEQSRKCLRLFNPFFFFPTEEMFEFNVEMD
jgi:hypothetical protein